MLRLGAEREELRVVADQIGAPTSAAMVADFTAQIIDSTAWRAGSVSDRSLRAGSVSDRCLRAGSVSDRSTHSIVHLCCAGETTWHGFAEEIFRLARQAGYPLAVRRVEPIASSEYPTPAARPHNSRGSAQFVNANDFVGEGNATHLGRYDEVGRVQLSPTPDPTVFLVDAWATYTAADGDELHAVMTGTLDGDTGAITATVTYVGGTGRFASATGTATLAAQLFPDGSIEVTVEGTIDY